MSKVKKYIFILCAITTYIASIMLLHKLALVSLTNHFDDRAQLAIEYILSSSIIFRQVATYIVALFILHSLPLFFIIKSIVIVSKQFSFSTTHKVAYFFLSLISFWLCVLAFTQLNFPRSAFSLIFPIFSSPEKTLWIGVVCLTLSAFINVLPVFISYSHHLTLPNTKWIKISLYSIIILFAFNKGADHLFPEGSVATEKPNIIFIGLDSVSPLHLEHNPEKYPYLRSLLKSGTTYSNAITPLARTYPTWTSILTGKYPVNHGARFNLVDLKLTNQSPDLLPKIFKRDGYYTIFAQDERKFNNIDKSFGFDKIVGPKAGAAEFILTKISDTPLVNLALLIPGSQYIFPFIHQNRADYIHYSPSQFPTSILKAIPSDLSRPIFLATHFCLAHFPYTWRDESQKTKGSTSSSGHQNALTAMEGQVKSLLEGLGQQGRLDNTILVLLSDHGESLGYENALWVDALKGDTHDSPSSFIPFNLTGSINGHGTNILDRTQYSTLLSFRGYGKMSAYFQPNIRSEITSLVDIFPTILSALGIQIPNKLDGKNLLVPFNSSHSPKIVSAETGIIFSALSNLASLDEGKLMVEARHFYTVDKSTGRLILKRERLNELISNKQYALHTKNWLLALLRSKNEYHPNSAVLVHKPSGQWTLGKNISLIDKSPIKSFKHKALSLYGIEISDFNSTWIFN